MVSAISWSTRHVAGARHRLLAGVAGQQGGLAAHHRVERLGLEAGAGLLDTATHLGLIDALRRLVGGRSGRRCDLVGDGSGLGLGHLRLDGGDRRFDRCGSLVGGRFGDGLDRRG